MYRYLLTFFRTINTVVQSVANIFYLAFNMKKALVLFALCFVCGYVHAQYNANSKGAKKALKSQISFHTALATGVWVPTGNLNVVGAHPYLGYHIGARGPRFMVDFSVYLRFLRSPNRYLVENNSNVYATNYFMSGYIGLNGGYKFWSQGRHEFDVLGGIGYDEISEIRAGRSHRTHRYYNGKQISSLNLNIGVGYKLFYTDRYYVSLSVKYNFLNYLNVPQSLSGNAVTIGLTFGFYHKPIVNISKYSSVQKS